MGFFTGGDDLDIFEQRATSLPLWANGIVHSVSLALHAPSLGVNYQKFALADSHITRNPLYASALWLSQTGVGMAGPGEQKGRQKSRCVATNTRSYRGSLERLLDLDTGFGVAPELRFCHAISDNRCWHSL